MRQQTIFRDLTFKCQNAPDSGYVGDPLDVGRRGAMMKVRGSACLEIWHRRDFIARSTAGVPTASYCRYQLSGSVWSISAQAIYSVLPNGEFPLRHFLNSEQIRTSSGALSWRSHTYEDHIPNAWIVKSRSFEKCGLALHLSLQQQGLATCLLHWVPQITELVAMVAGSLLPGMR